MVMVTLPRWPPCPYMIKTIFFSTTRSPIILKLGIKHRGLKLFEVYINDDPGMTLTYFMHMSSLDAYAFEWKNNTKSCKGLNLQI